MNIEQLDEKLDELIKDTNILLEKPLVYELTVRNVRDCLLKASDEINRYKKKGLR